MTEPARLPPSRGRRARKAVIAAFVELLPSQRYREMRVGELIARAGVARSTFYEHFHRKEDVLLASLEPVLQPLCDVAAGAPDRARLDAMLAHMWERRALARGLFEATGPQMQRHLADMIAARFARHDLGAVQRSLLARATAAAQLTMLRMWLTGEVPCAPEQLADYLLQQARGSNFRPGLSGDRGSGRT